MTRFVRIGLAAVAALALLGTTAVAPAFTQELASGTWEGTLTIPGGENIGVSFQVTGEGDELAIEMIFPPEAGMEPSMVDEVELTDEMLTFVLPIPTVRVVCELASGEQGNYEGVCVGDDGNSGYLLMTPPS